MARKLPRKWSKVSASRSEKEKVSESEKKSEKDKKVKRHARSPSKAESEHEEDGGDGEEGEMAAEESAENVTSTGDEETPANELQVLVQVFVYDGEGVLPLTQYPARDQVPSI